MRVFSKTAAIAAVLLAVLFFTLGSALAASATTPPIVLYTPVGTQTPSPSPASPTASVRPSLTPAPSPLFPTATAPRLPATKERFDVMFYLAAGCAVLGVLLLAAAIVMPKRKKSKHRRRR